MRPAGAASLAAILAVLALPSSAGAATCGETGSRTRAENSVARVYEDQSEDTIACSKANGRAELIAIDAYEYLPLLVLRGHYVAYHWRACEAGDSPCYASLILRDVRRKEPAFSTDDFPLRLLLRSNGSLAWSIDDRAYPDRGGSIHRRTRAGITRLDRGPGVDPESLRLRGRKLSWLSNGARRRATLR